MFSLNTYYRGIKTLFSKPQSNMYFKHANGKVTMTASNPSTQLHAFKKTNPLIKVQPLTDKKTQA
jgi:hypothetical protein